MVRRSRHGLGVVLVALVILLCSLADGCSTPRRSNPDFPKAAPVRSAAVQSEQALQPDLDSVANSRSVLLHGLLDTCLGGSFEHGRDVTDQEWVCRVIRWELVPGGDDVEAGARDQDGLMTGLGCQPMGNTMDQMIKLWKREHPHGLGRDLNGLNYQCGGTVIGVRFADPGEQASYALQHLCFGYLIMRCDQPTTERAQAVFGRQTDALLILIMVHGNPYWTKDW